MVVLAVSATPNPEAKPEAKPGLLAPVAYSAPLVTAPIVTATSSQSFVRNYNGIAAAPLIAAPVHYTAATAAYAPFSQYAAYASAPYAYSPYVAAPLKYTTAQFIV